MLALITQKIIKKRLNLSKNHWERFFDMSEDSLSDILFSVTFK
jgi:hypothetical protein